MSGMRKLREKRHSRVYRLISRIAHRSFCLDADERDRCHDAILNSTQDSENDNSF